MQNTMVGEGSGGMTATSFAGKKIISKVGGMIEMHNIYPWNYVKLILEPFGQWVN